MSRSPAVEQIALVPRPTLHVRSTVPPAGLPQAQGAALTVLARRLRSDGLTPVGHPYVRYHAVADDRTDVEIGIALTQAAEGDDELAAGELPGGDALRVVHLGSHDRLGESYAALTAAATASSAATAGPAWEVYHWIDPTVAPDASRWPPPEEWRTSLVQPMAAV